MSNLSLGEDSFQKIIARIQDQRFLFYLGAVIAGGVLVPIEAWIGALVIIGALVLAALNLVLGFFLARATAGRGVSGSGPKELALQFTGVSDASQLRFSAGSCNIEDTTGGEAPRKVAITPHLLGNGWICPMPDEVDQDDVITFTLTDSDNRVWEVGPVAVKYLLPKEDAVLLG